MAHARHRIPTGLTVEDRFISLGTLSLSVREVAIVLVGAAVGYGGVWKALAELPLPVRLTAALLPPCAALVIALARPGGQPLTQCLFIAARYRRTSRVSVWRPRPPYPVDWQPVEADWAGLEPRPVWDLADAHDSCTSAVGAGEAAR